MLDVNQITEEEKNKLLEIFVRFVNETRASCGESVYQVDRVNLACVEYMSEMVEVVENKISE
jgi:hypothetical protein